MAAQGAEESAAGALEGGVEDPGAGVEEAAEGEIRDTILVAYCFTFLKNSNISQRGEYEKSQPSPSPPLPRVLQQGQSLL
jgi:hypothetical protein